MSFKITICGARVSKLNQIYTIHKFDHLINPQDFREGLQKDSCKHINFIPLKEHVLL